MAVDNQSRGSMTLKEQTAEKHSAAESTSFMKLVFKQKLPTDIWADFTYQKSLIYNGIEGIASSLGLLKDLPDIQRAFYLYQDYKSLTDNQIKHTYRQVAIDYYRYILSLSDKPNKIMAHLYVWHMGDLYGGQMIKKIMPGDNQALTFKDAETLKTVMRSKLTDDMGEEANIAFDWAIKLLNDYDLTGVE
jgi:heme oxygenase